MRSPFGSEVGSEGRRPADEQHLLHALARIDRAPDVTGNVMHRLGYRPASARLAAQRRRRRVIARCIFTVIFGAAILGALSMESRRPDLRTPAAETVADALGRDLLMHESHLRGSVRLIRGLVGPGLAEGYTASETEPATFASGGFADGESDGPEDTHRAGFGDAAPGIGAPGNAERGAWRELHRAGLAPVAGPQWMGGETSGPDAIRSPRLLPGGFSIPGTAAPVPDVIDRSGIGPVAFGRGSAREAC